MCSDHETAILVAECFIEHNLRQPEKAKDYSATTNFFKDLVAWHYINKLEMESCDLTSARRAASYSRQPYEVMIVH